MDGIAHLRHGLAARWLALLAIFVAASLVVAKTDLDKMQSIALSRYGQDTANTVAEWRAMIDKIQPLNFDPMIISGIVLGALKGIPCPPEFDWLR